MRHLDMDSWPRRQHFNLFSSFNHPHFGLCANVDVSTLHAYVKQRGHSFSLAIVYLIARVANAIPEFRQRIREGTVVEHECVDPSFTVLVEHDLFGFCCIGYSEDFAKFAASGAEKMAYVKAHPSLNEDAPRDDVLFMTAIPWVSFTGFVHPMQQHPADSHTAIRVGQVF